MTAARAMALAAASATSGTLFALGDVVAQRVESRAFDAARTARMAAVGALWHAPFMRAGLRWLDRRYGSAAAASWRAALTKAVAFQVTVVPVFQVTFFSAVCALEGDGLRRTAERARERLPTIMITGCAYWPAVNVLNFRFVPPGYARLLYLNVTGFVWMVFLSWAVCSEAFLAMRLRL